MIKINNKNLNKLIYISTMKEIVGIKTNYKKKLEDLLFIDDQKDSLIKNTIKGQKSLAMIMPRELSVNIDENYDLKIAKFFLNN